MKNTPYLFFVVSLFTLALLQFLALRFYLYWIYPDLDIPMHALGGAVLAFGFLSAVGHIRLLPWKRGLPITLAVVVVIGIGWEVYEFITGSIFNTIAPLTDTLFDIVMDIVGGILGYFIIHSFDTYE